MDKQNRTFIIPVFIPHSGCPFKCTFCNQKTITGKKERKLTKIELEEIIDQFLTYKSGNYSSVQIAFYGGTFLGLKNEYMISILDVAEKYIKKKSVDSIRFSTRPDTITEKKLDIIKKYNVSTIEIGVQSMNNSILKAANRGHTEEDTISSVALLKKRGYNIGLQIMTGLPGDNEKKSLLTAEKVRDLKPDFVRIYPTVVLKESSLEEMYNKGEYTPQTLNECSSIVKKIYLIFYKSRIPVIRMGLQSSEDFDDKSILIAGPYHPAFGHLVFSEIFHDMAETILKKWGNEIISKDRTVSISVHPKNISKLRGLKNGNINILKNNFNLKNIVVNQSSSLKLDTVSIGEHIIDIDDLN